MTVGFNIGLANAVDQTLLANVPIGYNFNVPETQVVFSASPVGFGLLSSPTNPLDKGLLGKPIHSYMNDFYFRVYLSPQLIDLKSVTGETVETLIVWNAWPYSASTLTDVTVENDTGIETSPQPPFTLNPLQQGEFNIIAGTSGSAEINAIILFTFSTDAEPIAVRVIGNRVTKFSIPAEVPVDERWQWVTDRITAVDGTEQTISMTGGEYKTFVEYKVVLLDADEIREFRDTLLTGAGKLFIPEWQYSDTVKNPVTATTTFLEFNPARVDCRPGEFAMLRSDNEDTIVQILSVEVNGATLVQSPGIDFSGIVELIPGATGIVGDTTFDRQPSVDHAAEVTLSAELQRYRTGPQRPGTAPSFDTYLGMQILDKRPIASSLVGDTVKHDLVTINNRIGISDVRQNIKFSRVEGSRGYIVNRVKNPDDMDYWKAFAEITRGSARPFWMRTFRPDLKIASPIRSGINLMTVSGTDYASKIFPRFLSHRYFRIANLEGIYQYFTVLDSFVTIDGENSIIVLDRNILASPDFSGVSSLEYILPCRISDDTLSWQHSHTNSEITLNFITTTPE